MDDVTYLKRKLIWEVSRKFGIPGIVLLFLFFFFLQSCNFQKTPPAQDATPTTVASAEKIDENSQHTQDSQVATYTHLQRGQKIQGEVTHVADGDTLRLRATNGLTYRIRFQAIDAPELAQDFGPDAQAFLSELVLRKTVQVVVDKTDKFGRIVGRVWLFDPVTNETLLDVEETMLQNGCAWHYKRYDQQKKLAKAQASAKKKRRGLWSKKNPVFPEDWRQNR